MGQASCCCKQFHCRYASGCRSSGRGQRARAQKKRFISLSAGPTCRRGFSCSASAPPWPFAQQIPGNRLWPGRRHSAADVHGKGIHESQSVRSFDRSVTRKTALNAPMKRNMATRTSRFGRPRYFEGCSLPPGLPPSAFCSAARWEWQRYAASRYADTFAILRKMSEGRHSGPAEEAPFGKRQKTMRRWFLQGHSGRILFYDKECRKSQQLSPR